MPPFVLHLLRGAWLLGFCGLALSNVLQAQSTETVHSSSAQRMLPISAENPLGVAVDRSGNIYVVDQALGLVTEDVLSGDVYTSVVILTGLKSPTGIAVDLQGNLYITEEAHAQDGPDDVIKESVTANPSRNTYSAAVIPTMGLGYPAAIAVDHGGALYVADSLHSEILKLTPSSGGYVQSTLTISGLAQPTGVAVDTSGNLFIADSGSGRVVKETVSGSGYKESVITQYDGPIGVAVDERGTVYVLSSYGNQQSFVLEEIPSGATYTESQLALAHLATPTAIAADRSGNLYVVASGSDQMAKVTAGAGDAGPALLYTPTEPLSLVFTAVQDSVKVASVSLASDAFLNAGSGSCNTPAGDISFTGATCSVDVLFNPGSPGIQSGAVTLSDASGKALATSYIYGTGVAPFLQFPRSPFNVPGVYSHPTGMATDTNGFAYFTETTTGKLYVAYAAFHIDPFSAVIGSGLAEPMAVAVDPAGVLYVGSSSSIYKETPFPNSFFQPYQPKEVIRGLDHLSGLAIDGNANFYLISSSAGDVRKEMHNIDGTYTAEPVGSGIASPSGIAADIAGNVYVTDARHGMLYKETLAYDATYSQSVIATGLDNPEGVAVDGMGNLYVAISGAGAIYAYVLKADGSYQQTVEASGYPMVWGVAVGQSGTLYITQNLGAGSIVFAPVTTYPPVLNFANTRVGTMSADSPKTITFSNRGNAPLRFEENPFFPIPSVPIVPAGFTLSDESTCLAEGGVVPAGTSCTFTFSFLPQARNYYNQSAFVSDDNLDNFYPNLELDSLPLIGQGIDADTTRTTMRISSNPIKAGLGETIIVTVTDTTSASHIPSGVVTVTDTLGSTTTSFNGGSPLPLSGGKTMLTTTPSLPGLHTIIANYVGVDGSYTASSFETMLTVQP